MLSILFISLPPLQLLPSLTFSFLFNRPWHARLMFHIFPQIPRTFRRLLLPFASISRKSSVFPFLFSHSCRDLVRLLCFCLLFLCRGTTATVRQEFPLRETKTYRVSFFITVWLAKHTAWFYFPANYVRGTTVTRHGSFGFYAKCRHR